MGMYCCCGVKKRKEGYACECDWNGWFLCFSSEHFPKSITIKKPEIAGIYPVRVFCDSGDYYECFSEFSLKEKNWGQSTNQAISHWNVEYKNGYSGITGVYAWKDCNQNKE